MAKSVFTQVELMEKYPSIISVECQNNNDVARDIFDNRAIVGVKRKIIVGVINKYGDVSSFSVKEYDQIEKVVKAYLDIVDNEL